MGLPSQLKISKKKLVRSESLLSDVTSCEGATARWNLTTFTLIRWQSIRTISKREQLFYIHSQKKKSKKKLKKQISKKNLSATFHIFSKGHFLSHGKDVSGPQAVNGHPYQLTSNWQKNK